MARAGAAVAREGPTAAAEEGCFLREGDCRILFCFCFSLSLCFSSGGGGLERERPRHASLTRVRQKKTEKRRRVRVLRGSLSETLEGERIVCFSPFLRLLFVERGDRPKTQRSRL